MGEKGRGNVFLVGGSEMSKKNDIVFFLRQSALNFKNTSTDYKAFIELADFISALENREIDGWSFEAITKFSDENS